VEADAPCHKPVLLEEAVAALAPVSGGVYVDGNLGFGGHSRAILLASAPAGRVIAFDWDAEAIARAGELLAGFGDRLVLIHENFASMKEALHRRQIHQVDGILLDLGISSYHVDSSGRGFSFLKDEPLDMRMDTRRQLTARDLVNRLSEQELADIIYYYGEERQARRIASFLVEARRKKKIATSAELAPIVAAAVPKRFHPRRIHVATRTFQALRIAVNGELDNLRQVLEDGVELLKPAARFCVISFHSLEDRLVKNFFRSHAGLDVLTPRPVTPGPGEIAGNPRSRSARMRAATRRAAHGA